MKPRAILFDWDNTLVNSWPKIHEALNHCLAEMGHEAWSLEKVKSQVKQSMRDAFPTLFGDRWEEAAHIYQTYYRAIHLDGLEPLAGAVPLLDWLRAQPVYVAVVSNKRGPSLRKECEKLGWNHYFDRIIGADDAARDKPDVAPALMALDESAITQPDASVWFVGDTTVDLECAANLKATAVLYGDVPLEADGRFEGCRVDWHVKDHRALHQLLMSQLNAAA